MAAGGGAGDDPHPDRHVPAEVLEAARAAYDLAGPGELAALVSDSLVDEDAPSDDHRLCFQHPLVQIEVAVSTTARSSTLAGRLRPPAGARVALQREGGEISTLSDTAEGTFGVGPVSHGLYRLSVSGLAGAPLIRTDWFRI
jgi:hypothetical protein